MDNKDSPMFLDMLEKLLDRSETIRDELRSLDKKVELHVQKTAYELENINKLDEHQNKLLEEHIKRSNLLEETVEIHRKEINKRLEKIEEPTKALAFIRKSLITLGTLAGAIAAIYALFQMFGGN